MLNLGELWKQEWRAEGFAEGELKTQRETLRKILRQKFGQALPEHLAAATDADLLGRLTLAAACADSMSAFQALADKETEGASENA